MPGPSDREIAQSRIGFQEETPKDLEPSPSMGENFMSMSEPGPERLPAELTRLGKRIWQIALLYGLVGVLWITLSDSAMALLVSQEALVRLGIFKGLGFVMVTTGLLYVLNRRSFREVCKGYLLSEQQAAERQRAENESKGLAERLTTTFESITDAFYTVDREWRFTYMNHQAEKMLHCDRDKVRGEVLWDLFPDAVGTKFQEEFLRSTSENITVIFEEYYAPFDRWFEVRAFPSPHGLAVYFRDVSEQRKAQERILEQATLIDLARDAIVVHDLSRRILSWSQGAQRIYGWTGDEALASRFDELLSVPDQRFEEAYRAVVLKGTWHGELHKRTKSGAQVVMDCRWTRVCDANGEPASILSLESDITERKKIEADFLRSQRMESIGTLAGGIAHDLNNVLTPILVSVQFLKMGETDPDRLSMLQTAETSALRGAEMVGQVLSFARGMDGQKHRLKLQPVLADLLKIVRDTFSKCITITADVPDDLWPVLGDPTQLHQVLLNLCVNARDAMPEGGHLTISARNETLDEHAAALTAEISPGPYVCLDVEDTGSGISPEIVDKIFDPFFTTKEVGKGTGLGLSTSLGIVKNHGGSLHAYSEANNGSKFRIYLPAAEGEGKEVEPPTVRDQLPRGDDRLILVVDDESAVREVTRRTLEAYGYRVATASDGAEAVAYYTGNQEEVAVVLTDMMMPVMDGLATIRVLRKINPGVSIVAASGLATNGDVAKVASEGVRHFLPKPYTAAQLLNTLWLARQEG